MANGIVFSVQFWWRNRGASVQFGVTSVQFGMAAAQSIRLSALIRFEKVRGRFYKNKLQPKPSPAFSNPISVQRRLGIVQQKEIIDQTCNKQNLTSHIDL